MALVLWALGLLWCPLPRAQDLSEYRLKAAFLYNFAVFTEWPESVGPTLNLCIYGADPFGAELTELHGKTAGIRVLLVERVVARESLGRCQLIFVAAAAMAQLPQVLRSVEGRVALTIADSPGAARQGVAINMALTQSKVSFEVNLKAARDAGVTPSAKLLRLATEIYQ